MCQFLSVLVGSGILLPQSMLKPEHRDRIQMPGFPSQCCLALGLLFIHRKVLEAVFPKGSKSRR